jgi:hypothetical protein
VYLTLFTDTGEVGKTAYTDTALSLVVDFRSSESFGNSMGRHDQARIG